MPTNFKQFEKDVATFGKTLLPRKFILFQKKIALEVFTRTIPRTPVDTGRARGNWQIGIGVIPASETGKVDKDGSGTINAGLTELEGLGRNQTVYIANNVPYISFLEEGSSPKQAPQGMLALSIQEVEMMFTGVE